MGFSVSKEGTTNDCGRCSWCSCVNHRCPEFRELKPRVARPCLKCGIKFWRQNFRLDMGKPDRAHSKAPERREPWKLP